MAASSGNTVVFDCQVKACEEFFQKPLPKVQDLKPLENDDIPEDAKRFTGPIYDITSFDAREVVALLSRIVNDREQFKMNKTFYLLLRNGRENKPDAIHQELFKLKARPTTDQPGNATVFLRPRGKKKFKTSVTTYTELHGALKASYKDTASFASDIIKLFKKDAVVINDFPEATYEAYAILLFEIARRLVALEDPSDKKVQYDVLPIGSAIARIVKLLGLDSKDTRTFDDVFFPGHQFDCFTGKVEKRKKAINNINDTTLATYGASVLKQDSVESHLEELKQMFCSEKPEAMLRKEEKPEAMLRKHFEALSVSVADSKALSMKTKKSAVNTEIYTAFDYI